MPSKRTKRSAATAKNSTKKSSFTQLATSIPMRVDPVYTVTKRVVGLAVCVSNVAIDTFTANGITLGSFGGYGDLAAAFDQYRIDEVEFEYLPRQTISDGAGAVNPGIFTSVVDYDDNTVLTTVAKALAYPNAQVWTPGPGKTHLLKHRFVPRIAMAAYQGGVFTGYANAGKQWLDCGTPSVAHFGVKTAWTVTSVALTMDLLITGTISFRSSRS